MFASRVVVVLLPVRWVVRLWRLRTRVERARMTPTKTASAVPHRRGRPRLVTTLVRRRERREREGERRRRRNRGRKWASRGSAAPTPTARRIRIPSFSRVGGINCDHAPMCTHKNPKQVSTSPSSEACVTCDAQCVDGSAFASFMHVLASLASMLAARYARCSLRSRLATVTAGQIQQTASGHGACRET